MLVELLSLPVSAESRLRDASALPPSDQYTRAWGKETVSEQWGCMLPKEFSDPNIEILHLTPPPISPVRLPSIPSSPSLSHLESILERLLLSTEEAVDIDAHLPDDCPDALLGANDVLNLPCT